MARTDRRRLARLFAASVTLIGSCRSDSDAPAGDAAPAASQSVIVPVVDRVMPLCEYAGTIRRVVVHARAATLRAAARPIHDLLRALDESIAVEIVCEGEATRTNLLAALRQWKLDRRPGLRLHVFPDAISQWARDRYIACVPAGWPIWLVPQIPPRQAEPSRLSELDVPEAFTPLVPDLEVRRCALALEGGNLIATGKRVFLGAGVIEDNAPARSARQTREALARVFAGPSIIVGDGRGRAPLAHLDLFLTLIAEDQALLSSPASGKTVLEAAGEDDRRAVAERLGGIPPDFSTERIAQFAEVAALLERQGLRVTRLPHADNRGGDFAITYANVLQETRQGRRIVYLPIYRVPALDGAAIATYESLGFEVRRIDVSGVCHLLGMVRCLANVVERDNDAPRN